MNESIYLIILGVLGAVIIVLLYVLSETNRRASNPNPNHFQNIINNEVETKLLEKTAIIKADLVLQNNVQLENEKLKLSNEIEKNQAILKVKLEVVEGEERKLEEKKQKLESSKYELEKQAVAFQEEKSSFVEKLSIEMERIAGTSMSDAKQKILDDAEREMGEELITLQNKMVARFEAVAMDKAREITTLAVERCASEVTNEFTITNIKVENEGDKGKLIGKGGRNIQWLEKTLGVEVVIDDTPNTITISGFSAVRRHIAKKTIEKLLKDGRIHPSSIEEQFEKAKQEIAVEIFEAGNGACNDLGIYDFPEELVRLIGRLKFRTSYGQNMLKHSVEMAKLAGLLCDGLNAEFPLKNKISRDIAVKGALLHDIGKAGDEESIPKGNHIALGEKICDMFGLDKRIKRCITSHHTTGGDWQSYYDNITNTVCLEAAIVDACDTLSGGRPGARKETLEAYFQRLEGLENIAKSVPGVVNAWIMRAATELWVFFDTDKVAPSQMHRITRKLARDIHNNMKTPKEVKVIGLWQDRVVEYSR
jgi:ribonucrease Y